jgi:hypothetical protein
MWPAIVPITAALPDLYAEAWRRALMGRWLKVGRSISLPTSSQWRGSCGRQMHVDKLGSGVIKVPLFAVIS